MPSWHYKSFERKGTRSRHLPNENKPGRLYSIQSLLSALGYTAILSAVAASLERWKSKPVQCLELKRHSVAHDLWVWGWRPNWLRLPEALDGGLPYPRWTVRMCFWMPAAVLSTLPQFFQRHLNITFMEFYKEERNNVMKTNPSLFTFCHRNLFFPSLEE
jgi:hypothetical protein